MRYDANVKVNVTIEYPDDFPTEQRRSDIKADLEMVFGGFDTWMGGAHIYVAEVLSSGQPTRID